MYLKRLAVLIKLFPRASRLPFLIGSLIPAGLGSTLAYVETGELKLLRLGLVLLGMAFVHLSVNMFNDYFDARYGVDTAHPPRPLSGGSQVLQEGLESEQEILWQAVLRRPGRDGGHGPGVQGRCGSFALRCSGRLAGLFLLGPAPGFKLARAG